MISSSESTFYRVYIYCSTPFFKILITYNTNTIRPKFHFYIPKNYKNISFYNKELNIFIVIKKKYNSYKSNVFFN